MDEITLVCSSAERIRKNKPTALDETKTHACYPRHNACLGIVERYRWT